MQQQPVTEAIVHEVGQALLGKQTPIRLSLACLLAQGHLLLEDLPGMGKTTLAHALAKVLGLSYQRLQFTSDMLPADIIGVSIFNSSASAFEFKPGPVFTQLLLADEINRATPKAQSALLEAMEERQVTVDAVTHPLPKPFFVIATQNPISQMGTFPLPESQLDRFLMRLSLGYPDPQYERQILLGKAPASQGQVSQGPMAGRADHFDALHSLLSAEQFAELQQQVDQVRVADAVLDYVQRLVQFSRDDSRIQMGLSPRGAQALVRAARAWALLAHRDYLLPEDVQQVFPAVANHRLMANQQGQPQAYQSLADLILDEVEVLA